MAKDLEIHVARLVAFGQQALCPLERVLDAPLGRRIDPDGPQPRPQGLRLSQALGQLQDGVRVRGHLRGGPSAQRRPCGVKGFPNGQLELIALR